MKLTYSGPHANPQGWMYLWAKVVYGADFTKHCAKCLLGDYLLEFGKKMQEGRSIEFTLPDTQFLYICGVSEPYVWEKNLHGAFRNGTETVTLPFYNGQGQIIVEGVSPLVITPDFANLRFPNLGDEYLTCRNFQFAATYLQ